MREIEPLVVSEPESILPASEYSAEPVKSKFGCFDFFSFKSKILLFSISFNNNLRFKLFSNDFFKLTSKSKFVSNSIFVQFDGHREAEGEFRVFYKIFRNDGDDNQIQLEHQFS